MANFQKLSFWYMCGMSFVTLCLYPLAWMVDTARDLRRAGGKVPSTYFYFGPFLVGVVIYIFGSAIYLSHGFDVSEWAGTCRSWFMIFFTVSSLYFWFGYVRAYCQIVMRKNDKKTIWGYFILWEGIDRLPLLLSVLLNFKPLKQLVSGCKPLVDVIKNIATSHSFITGLAGYVVFVICMNIFKFLFFQRGFNKYVEQNN